LAFSGLLIWINAHQSRVDETGFNEIQNGMTLSDVVETLRAEPGNHASLTACISLGFGGNPDMPLSAYQRIIESDHSAKVWGSNNGLIIVRFNESLTVQDKELHPVVHRPESVTDKLVRWLTAAFP
jgi:hypothetical protein